MVKIHYEHNAEKKAELTAKMSAEIMPNYMKFFEARLSKNSSGYFVGSGLTWTDLYFTTILDYIGDKKATLLESFPAIKAHDEKIRNLPNIAKWIETRPKTAM